MILPGTGRGTAGEAGGGGGAPRTVRPEIAIARKLRRTMSYPEVLLWQHLRGTGVARFRRQHPIGPYVVDFYCSSARLIVEVDGEIHATSPALRRDPLRDRFFTEIGYRTIHVAAREILADAGSSAASIVALAARPLHHSPPASGPPPRPGEDQE